MVTMTMKYGNDLDFEITHAPSGTIIKTDAPVDNQGKGRSFSPTDLVATALATCMGTTMALVGNRHQVDLSGMTITVTKEMTSAPVRRIGTLTVTIVVPRDFDDDNKKRLIHAAEACPVKKSLHSDVNVVTHFKWGE